MNNVVWFWVWSWFKVLFTDKTVGELGLRFSPLCVSSRYLEGHVVPYWTIF